MHNRRSGKCLVCQHPDRFRAEMMLAGGASNRAVVAKLGLGVSTVALWRHWTNHVHDDRKAQLIAGPLKLHELAERAAEVGLSLLDYFQLIRSTLLSQFTTSAEAGDAHATSIVAGRLLETLREIGRLTGELQRLGGGATVTNNIMLMNSPAFVELQAMLMARLAPFPEARAAVIEGLSALDGRIRDNRVAGLEPLPAPLVIDGEAA